MINPNPEPTSPYLGTDFWNQKHRKLNERWLTGSRLSSYVSFFHSYFNPTNKAVLEVGCGLAVATKQIAKVAEELWVVDISPQALERARGAGAAGTALVSDTIHVFIPQDHFDLAISYLVVQHMRDHEVLHQLNYVLDALKPDGIFCVQFLTRTDVDGDYNEMLRAGTVSRSVARFEALVQQAGGKVIDQMPTRDFRNDTTDNIPVIWNGFIVGKGKR